MSDQAAGTRSGCCARVEKAVRRIGVSEQTLTGKQLSGCVPSSLAVKFILDGSNLNGLPFLAVRARLTRSVDETQSRRSAL